MVRFLRIRFLRRPKFMVALAVVLFLFGGLVAVRRLSSTENSNSYKTFDSETRAPGNERQSESQNINILRGSDIQEMDQMNSQLQNNWDNELTPERTQDQTKADISETLGVYKEITVKETGEDNKAVSVPPGPGFSSKVNGIQTVVATDGSLQEPNDKVHIFYYPWYGNPKHDGKFIHWNHEYLPHWNAEVAKRYRKGRHVPPDDIGANFYPELGPYSSLDPLVINDHMKQMQTAGVGVLVVSWYPPDKADGQGVPWDSLVSHLLDAALKYKLKLTLHIEPYNGRSDRTVHEDVKYIIDKYGEHDAFYKYKSKNGRFLPMLYIYDSYHTKPHDWAQLLTPSGSHSVRNTKYDCIFICLMVEMSHRDYVEIGGFDGFYTYFAVDHFTYGSTWRYWPQLASLAKQTNSIFIPSVGPGYVDTNVRPWNEENTRSRENGDYYRRSWKAALNVHPDIIAVTSFNEWHEGTQIEKAVPKSVSGLVYRDYSPNEPDYYLKLTREFVDKFRSDSKN